MICKDPNCSRTAWQDELCRVCHHNACDDDPVLDELRSARAELAQHIADSIIATGNLDAELAAMRETTGMLEASLVISNQTTEKAISKAIALDGELAAERAAKENRGRRILALQADLVEAQGHAVRLWLNLDTLVPHPPSRLPWISPDDETMRGDPRPREEAPE